MLPGTGYVPISDAPVADVGGAAASATATTNPAEYPEVMFGVPMRGAPWYPVFFTEAASPIPNPAPVVVSQPQVYEREIMFGPPMIGAPWAQNLFVEPFVTQSPAIPPVIPVGPFPLVRSLPFVPRVPEFRGADYQARLRSFTEQTSVIFNSLIGQEILVQTGPASWTIDLAAISGSGATGTFTAGSFP